MGVDKARLAFEGVPLAERALTVLWSVSETVVIAPGRRRLDLGVPEIPDARPGAGPLGGLVAGLEHVARGHRTAPALVAVLAVDLPLASGRVLRALATACSGKDVVAPLVDGRVEPLHAVWSTEAAPVLRAQLERGRLALTEALEQLDVLSAGPQVWAEAARGVPFWRNVNAPEDLRDLPPLPPQAASGR